MPSCQRPQRDSGAPRPLEHAIPPAPRSNTNARKQTRRRLPERAASSVLVAATVLRDQCAVALHQPSSSRPAMHSAEMMHHSLPTASGCGRRPCSRRRSRPATTTRTSETGVLASIATRSARERRGESWGPTNKRGCGARSASSASIAGPAKRPAFTVKGGGWKVTGRGSWGGGGGSGVACMSQASQQVFQPQAGERREGPDASAPAVVVGSGAGHRHRGRDGDGSGDLYQPELQHCNPGQRCGYDT